MDNNRIKNASQWFYNTIFREESIQPRSTPDNSLPASLRAARALEAGTLVSWQSREALFVKQAKLLVDYTDDYAWPEKLIHYYPTYQSLSDPELRGYFAWRTLVRKTEVRPAPLTFAFLYIYELLNQIGVDSPEDGYRKLIAFREAYTPLNPGISGYLGQWLTDYAVYYSLDPALLTENPDICRDAHIACLADITNQSPRRIAEAAAALAPRWLSRSKFYRANREDMNTVIAGVLVRMADHYVRRSKYTLAEQLFGTFGEYPVRLFDAAVFHDRQKKRSCEYTVSAVRMYICRRGSWFVRKYGSISRAAPKLEDLMKTIDAVMRSRWDFRPLIKQALDTKWILKAIETEADALLSRKKAEQLRKQAEAAQRITIDHSLLDRIRADAAITRDKLVTEEELSEETLPNPAPEPEPRQLPAEPASIPAVGEPPLSAPEYRLLQCLLYHYPLDWVRAEGRMLSVLVDGINEKLYDTFADSVLLSEEPPEPVEDYIEDLKEMVQP